MVRATSISLACLGALLLPVLASAEAVTLSATNVVLIENPADGTFRALIKFSGFSQLEGKEIYSATLMLPHISLESRVRLVTHPLTTAWEPGTVTWTSPWDEDGGDYDSDIRSVYDIYPGRDSARTIRLNVTEYVRSVLDGESDYGLIIMPPLHNGDGLSSALEDLFVSASNMRIAILYSQAP